MRLNSIDIKSTFLQRKTIYRDIFIVSLLEAGTEKPRNLKKYVYVLNDAFRN